MENMKGLVNNLKPPDNRLAIVERILGAPRARFISKARKAKNAGWKSRPCGLARGLRALMRVS
jgi:hypothetical protein